MQHDKISWAQRSKRKASLPKLLTKFRMMLGSNSRVSRGNFLVQAGLLLFSGSFLLPSFGSSANFLTQSAFASPTASKTRPNFENYYDILPDIIEEISSGVVNISSTTVVNYQVFGMDDFLQLWGIPQERKATTLGSGLIIDNDGYVLTNNHVVERANEVIVTLSNKEQYRAKIIGKDQKMDLALIQIKDKANKVPSGLKPVPLGDSDAVRIGETVLAVGNPFGLQNTVTRGIISAKNRTIGLGPFDNFLQTDASVNPGNSGGPLFNLKGAVIGINSAIRSQTGQSSGLSFAIPINEAKILLPDLKRYGRVPRPWLGILGERITPQLEAHYELPASTGVLIFNLVRKGPADAAGIQQGDVIVSIDETLTLEPNDVERILAKHRPNESIKLKFYRGKGKIKEVRVKLAELPRLEHLPRGII